MNHNIYAVFAERFGADPGQPAIETESGRVYSYGELEQATARLANFFTGMGLVRGDRLAVQVEKSVQAYFLYLAVVRAGLVYLPLNPAYQRGELEFFLADARPRLVVCSPERLPLAQELAAQVDAKQVLTLDETGGGTLTEVAQNAAPQFATAPCEASDLAVILYTSGTTGRSKGAMISHGNLAANALALSRAWQFSAQDVLLHALPLFHIHGLFLSSHCALITGAKMLFLDKFDAERVLAALPRASVFMGVPTYYTRLLALPAFDAHACRSIRLFVSGSAPLLSETFNAFRERTGHTIVERYGMTETGVNTSNPLAGERIAGSVGLPLEGTAVRVVDDDNRALPAGEVGHIQVKGANVFAGYWRLAEKNQTEFTADGYFKTGDMGRLDAQGYLFIIGRSKDLVISGGLNVYPKEIESLIDAIPGVVESAVIGLTHADFGEAVTAVVVRREDAGQLDESTVVARLKTQLANYKVPKRVFFVDDLPRNAMGKVQKNLLREQYAATYSGSKA